MRRSITAFALLFALALCGATGAWAQVLVFNSAESDYDGAPNVPHIFMFESLEADTLFWGSYGTTPEDDTDRDYAYWAHAPDVGITPVQGDGALYLDWAIWTDADWGGSSALQHFLPDSVNGELRGKGDLYDFSDFTHINMSYLTITPTGAVPATFRLKMHDASEGLGTAPSSETEDWYSESSTMYQDVSGEWQVYSVPLESMGNVSPGSGGFSRPGCPSSCWSGIYGNGELDLDMIAGFQLEFTSGQAGADNDSTTGATVVWDNLYVSGVRYDLLASFDGAISGGNNGGGTSSRVTVADTVEGTGAMELTYDVNGGESWGGSADIYLTPEGSIKTAQTHISIFYKVIDPVVKGSDSDNARMIFKLRENSTGVTEEYHYATYDVLGDTSGKWRRLLMPIDEFAMPSWWGDRGDEILQVEDVIEIQFQVIVDNGQSAAGKVLFDRMTTYGFQATDFEPPAAVENLVVTASAMSNIIEWTDVPGEDGEEYNIYFSYDAITDVTAAGVMEVALGVSEGLQAVTHDIYAPVSDQDVTHYYAIEAVDAADNVGEATVSGGVTNMARGIPTISLTVPAGFAADGDLSEWGSHTPIHLEDGTAFGWVPRPTYDVSSPTDLSADIYLAIDAEAIYLAYDVNDDQYFGSEGITANLYQYDGAELLIGLYDSRSVEHAAYNREDEPDYKINMFSDSTQLDYEGGILLYENGSANYSFTQKTGGYIIEAKMAYADFAYTAAPAFVPKNGMRVPLDIAIQDNDTGAEARQGYMAYSFDNDDNSYLSPQNWFYTWIGDRIQVGLESVGAEVPQEYALYQNYPNPFNPSTLFRYDVRENGRVTLKVFNVLGQEVHTLVDGDQLAGTYEVTFDASNLASGVYFYQLRAGDFVQTKKMMLVR